MLAASTQWLPEASARDAAVDVCAGDCIALLERAVAAGYRDAADLRSAADLNPVRRRGGFQRLVAKLARAVSPLPAAVDIERSKR